MKLLRWSSMAGFITAAGYYWQKGNIEIALGFIGILISLITFFYQKGGKEDRKEHDSWLTSFFRGRSFKKQYFTLLRYQNRDFDIKGLSTQTEHTLELDQVFIELKLQPQAAHKATADPLQNAQSKFRGDSYPIWRFFSMLSDNEGIQNPKLVVVGPPGSGKTTLLRHITLLLTSNSKNAEIKKLKLKKIPFLLFLRDHVNQVEEHPSILLPEIIEADIKKWDVSIALSWFSKKLKSGECLVLLDGLDEIADPVLRRKMVIWLEKQIHTYPKNAFIITSRPHGYKENPITGVSVLEVMPFNRSQIDHFVQKWYLANEVKSHDVDDPGVRMTAKSGADDLLRRLEKTPTLMELAVNPLLLTMIATVHRYRSALPGRRVELYKEICEVFLGRRQESKGLSLDLVPAQKQSVLQTLAYEMMCGNIREIRKSDAFEIIGPSLLLVAPNLGPENFLKSIEQKSGLLLEREIGIYGFAHKTFQEYLASMYVLEKSMEGDLYHRINDDWWHEVIKLYSAQTDATKIITLCLDQDPPSSVALSLAIQCLEEAHQVQPKLRDIAERILLENAEDPDPEIRSIVGQALLSNRLKHLSALSPSIFIDTKLVTNAEYQVFIDDMLARNMGDYHPAHWRQVSFPKGTAHAPVTGLTPEDSLTFCEWLTDLHAGSGEWYFRLPVKDEIIPANYLELPGFWMLQKSEDKISNKQLPVEMWVNPKLPWPHIPEQFVPKTTQEDIKTVISYFRFGNEIPELNDDLYRQLGDVLKRLMKSSQNLNQLLADTADQLYTMITPPFTRPVDFAYDQTNLNVYDQSISDTIELFKNPDFQDGMMSSVKCFSDLSHSNAKSTGRYKSLFTAFAFTFLIKWMKKNKSVFTSANTESIKNKIGYLMDQYMDSLIIHGRQLNITQPFEGLLFIKEIKERPLI